jgi:hypothetical protein
MSMTPPRMIRVYSGLDAASIEIVLTDGPSLTGSTEIVLKDEGIYVASEGDITLYPWHRVNEVRGLPA